MEMAVQFVVCQVVMSSVLEQNTAPNLETKCAGRGAGSVTCEQFTREEIPK